MKWKEMDTLYYRKIAEIMIREASLRRDDEPMIHPDMLDVARETLVLYSLKKGHKRMLRAYMYDWITRLEASIELTTPTSPAPPPASTTVVEGDDK